MLIWHNSVRLSTIEDQSQTIMTDKWDPTELTHTQIFGQVLDVTSVQRCLRVLLLTSLLFARDARTPRSLRDGVTTTDLLTTGSPKFLYNFPQPGTCKS